MSEALVRRYFDALARLDGEAMAACLHPLASYTDPVFPDLRGDEVGWRWRALTGGATDMHLAYDILFGDERKAQVQWQASYRFAASGRKVSNRVLTTLTFWDGKIVRQTDEYDFRRWARASLGAPGWLLGWLPALQRAAQRRARSQLRNSINAAQREPK
ncbi:MAG TPA: nuclear transport factor 2 family protein [Burkholderiaceae bacterium]